MLISSAPEAGKLQTREHIETYIGAMKNRVIFVGVG